MGWPPPDGTPYMPANGTEGEIFQSEWCVHCSRDCAFRDDPDSGDGCAILGASMFGEQPKEWSWRKGEPHCAAYTEDPNCQARCPLTMEMFPDGETMGRE